MSKIIPLNEIPDEIIENVNEKVEINNLLQPQVNNKQTPNGNFRYNLDKEIAFAWGFLFFDIPNITVNGNKIYFTGEIHRESVHELKEKIIEVAKELNSIKTNFDKEIPIYLFINSPGGAVHSGFDLIDFIENFEIPIITIGTGRVASMGVMLLLAGKERYLTPNAHILIHQISTMIGGKRQDILDFVKHLEDLHKQIIKYITKKTSLKQNQVEDLVSKESWLTVEEAINMGIVDGIWKK